jgi:hypothetical protein
MNACSKTCLTVGVLLLVLWVISVSVGYYVELKKCRGTKNARRKAALRKVFSPCMITMSLMVYILILLVTYAICSKSKRNQGGAENVDLSSVTSESSPVEADAGETVPTAPSVASTQAATDGKPMSVLERVKEGLGGGATAVSADHPLFGGGGGGITHHPPTGASLSYAQDTERAWAQRYAQEAAQTLTEISAMSLLTGKMSELTL